MDFVNVKKLDSGDVDIEVQGKENTYFNWFYPEIYDRDNQNYIQVTLFYTRASDDIMIKYDSDRGGWVIEQPVVEWRESAFCEAWKFDESE